MPKKKQDIPYHNGGAGRWVVVIILLMLLGFISMVSAFVVGLFISSAPEAGQGNVAMISIDGTILANDPSDVFGNGVADAETIVEFIEKAEKDDDIVAMIYEINSPGGTAVASHEIAHAIASSNKTTVAWIREVGASGAYWVASATDHIVANPMSITGSVGVIGSYLDFSRFIERYNVSYQRLVSGKYKDMGTPFRELAEDEEMLIQESLDLIHGYFVDAVLKSRDIKDVEDVKTGRIYVGVQAKELGLIDQLGGKEEAITYIEEKHGIVAEPVEFEEPKTFAELLTEVFSKQSFSVGEGIGSSIKKDRGFQVLV